MSTTERQATGLRKGPLNERLQILALLVLTLVTAGLAVMVVTGYSGDPTEAVDAEGEEPSSVTSAGPADDVDDTPRVVFIGDEWAQGAGASAADKSFTALAAAELGWNFDVDAVPGSGWTKSAPDVPNSRFVDRAERLSDGENAADLVVLSAQTPSGSGLRVVARRIEQTVETVREQVPGATVVIVLPVANNQAEAICPPPSDDPNDVVCIDTFTAGWLTPGERGKLMNSAVRAPNDDGHARLADFLVEELRAALVEQ